MIAFVIYYLKHRRECCIENTAQGSMLRDKYEAKQRAVFILRHAPECCIFCTHEFRLGTDPEINQGGGWLMFQIGSFIYIVIVSITVAAKFKDMKWGVSRVLA